MLLINNAKINQKKFEGDEPYWTNTIHKLNKWCSWMSFGKPLPIEWKPWERFKGLENLFHTNGRNDRQKRRVVYEIMFLRQKETVFCNGLRLAMKNGYVLKISHTKIMGSTRRTVIIECKTGSVWNEKHAFVHIQPKWSKNGFLAWLAWCPHRTGWAIIIITTKYSSIC